MSKRKAKNLLFPAKGLDRRAGYEGQPPYSSPSLQNVRYTGVLEERERGGSRPGIGKAFYEQLGSGAKVNLLSEVTLNDTSGFRQFAENFSVATLTNNGWSAVASYSSNMPGIYDSASAILEYADTLGGAIKDAMDPAVDSTQAYTVEMVIDPYEGSFGGKYLLWACANDTTPDPYDEGLVAEIVMDDATEAWTGTLKHYKSGSLSATYTFTAGVGTGNAASGRFWFLINGSSVKVYWQGTLLTSQTLTLTSPTTHRRVGFAMECTVEGGACLVSSFLVQYYTDDAVTQARRTLTVAASNGTLYREGVDGVLETVSSNLSLNASKRLRAAEYGSKLYIADYGDAKAKGADGVLLSGKLDAASISDWTAIGLNLYDFVVVVTNGTGATTDGTYKISAIASGDITLSVDPGDGTCTYHIERGPKIYDPAANTLTLWVATTAKGQVPTGCALIAEWRGRMVMASGNLWSMSRQLDMLDWDYGGDSGDYSRAVSGLNTEVGHVGEDITAIMPHHNDYLYFGCASSVYILRGDPTGPGASLGPIGGEIGCVGGDAWTVTDTGTLVWLADAGLYGIQYGGEGYPTGLSKSVPRELHGLTSDLYQVSLAFDRRSNGVHVFVHQEGVTQTHWWLDWMTNGLFPVAFGDDDHAPYCAMVHRSTVQDSTHVLLGCSDGYIRHFSEFYNTDDGTEIESYVELGPFRLGDGYDLEGIIEKIDAILGYASGSIDWSLRAGKSAEATSKAGTIDSGTWDESEGVQRTVWPMVRGKSAIIRLDNSDLVPWAMENVSVLVTIAGPSRLL